MSRRIKRSVTIAPLKNENGFESTAVTFIEPDDKFNIAKAIKDHESAVKEETLLAAELEKPFAARNQALMRKYGYSEIGANIDKYPDIGGTVKYKIKIYAPEDPTIPIEKRPKTWYVGVIIEYEGDEFTFRFPIARSTTYQDEVVYKLDGYDVFLDPSLNIIQNISGYSLYSALLDFKHEVTKNASYIGDAFETFGITKIPDNVFDPTTKKDFRVRNQNFTVNSSVNRAKTDTLVPPKVESGVAGHINFKEGYTIKKPYKVVDKRVDVAEKALKHEPKHTLLGLKSGDQIPKKDLILDTVFTNVNITPTAWFALSSYDASTHSLGLSLINGAGSVKGFLKKYNGKALTLEQRLIEINQRLFKAYKDKETTSIGDQFE